MRAQQAVVGALFLAISVNVDLASVFPGTAIVRSPRFEACIQLVSQGVQKVPALSIPLIDQHFLLPIEDVFTIQGRTAITGLIERGKIKVGDEVEIVGFRPTIKKVVTGVEMFRKVTDESVAGDNVGVTLGDTMREEIERGQVLAKPGSISPHTRFTAETCMVTADEGGRRTPFYNKYRPQFYFRTTDVTGEVMLAPGVDNVMPGDRVTIDVTLTTPLALEVGTLFAIREGGRTVGGGVVRKMLAPLSEKPG